jgi:hypothetical protein
MWFYTFQYSRLWEPSCQNIEQKNTFGTTNLKLFRVPAMTHEIKQGKQFVLFYLKDAKPTWNFNYFLLCSRGHTYKSGVNRVNTIFGVYFLYLWQRVHIHRRGPENQTSYSIIYF